MAKAASEVKDSELINDQNLWNRCAQLFSGTLLPNMSIAKTLNQTRVLEPPKNQKLTSKISKKIAKKKPAGETLNFELGGKKKPMKKSDYGQTKFNKREDGKLHVVVQNIWDSQLHSELEEQLKLDDE